MRHSMKAAMRSYALQIRISRRVCALICLALFLLLQLFAVSGALHRAVHADAAAPNHHCVVTLLAKGQVSAPQLAIALSVFIAPFFFHLPLLQPAVCSASDHRLSPGRAPPAA